MANDFWILLAMVIYFAAMLSIGFIYSKRSNSSSKEYFAGGRGVGPWLTALSAEASDMSGWLLMGLPGLAYFTGAADPMWTAVGLALGTYLNWKLVARRLRRYSVVTDDAITIPDFFAKRFHDKKGVISTIAAVIILVFFSVYVGSCFVTVGKLFATLFGFDYHVMMIIGAVFVLIYTIIGGFLAESVSDFMQAVVMIVALVVIVVTGTVSAGGLGAVIDNAQSIPGFLEFFGVATPTTVDGVQQVVNGTPQFGAAENYGILDIVSPLAWGLGYFGMPQVLLHFMAIRNKHELTRSRRIATVWVVISLVVAVFIGVVGRTLYPDALMTAASAENVFILLSTRLLPPLLAGLVMAGILAATISSSDSYLLIAASAFSKNIYQGLLHRKATDKQVLTMSRITLLVITAVAVVIALDENSVIFTIVSFAWAGFGATFGPLIILSLFWKRINRAGAIAGMISGGSMVFIWNLLIRPLGGLWDVYELLPAFLFSCLCIVVVSLLTPPPAEEIQKEFDEVRAGA